VSVYQVDYGLYGRGAIPGRRFYFCRHRVQTGFEAHPASCSVGTGAVFLGVTRPGPEADNSLSSSIEVKNGRAIRPLPDTFYGVVLNELSMETALSYLFTYQ
jgi:hypothetical protein